MHINKRNQLCDAMQSKILLHSLIRSFCVNYQLLHGELLLGDFRFLYEILIFTLNFCANVWLLDDRNNEFLNKKYSTENVSINI